jgi:hypothetical protein
MSNLKKRQHYVWRNYLRPWSQNENIWTYFKELKKIERPSLMGVAQEKYFYKLIDLTEDEETFLRLFIESLSSPLVKDFNLDFLAMFTSASKLKKSLEQIKDPTVERAFLEEQIRKIEINLMEDSHCKFEELGMKLISYRSLEDLKTIVQDNYHHDGLMFLCFQYFRTRKMKNSVVDKFKGTKYENLMEKSWNILAHTFALNVTNSMVLNERIKYVFIKNDTDEKFLTGDQPVFNLLSDQMDEKGNVLNLELYYPLTPKHALNIHFRADQVEQFEVKYADKELINYLNKKVIEQADFYIFSDTKEQLEKMKLNNWL